MGAQGELTRRLAALRLPVRRAFAAHLQQHQEKETRLSLFPPQQWTDYIPITLNDAQQVTNVKPKWLQINSLDLFSLHFKTLQFQNGRVCAGPEPAPNSCHARTLKWVSLGEVVGVA